MPGVDDLERMPSLRGRIVAIAGVPVETAPVAAGRRLGGARRPGADLRRRAARRTPRSPPARWWPADYAGPPLLSLDAGLAAGFGVGVGDTLTLNVLGRDIVVEIASLRGSTGGRCPSTSP